MLAQGRTARKEVTLKFGEVIAFKVNVFGAVAEDKNSSLHNACMNDHPITLTKQKLYCPVCNGNGINAEPQTGLVKAQSTPDGLVFIPAETLAAANEAEMAFYEVIDLSVHDTTEVSSVLQPSGKSYYLDVSSPAFANLYTMLADLVRDRPDKAFMARWTLKTAVTTYRLVLAGEGTLVLQQQADPDLVRAMPVVASTKPKVAAESMILAQLADALTVPFDVAAISGRAKSKVLAEYTEGQVAVAATAAGVPVPAAGLLDLTALLTAALEKAAPPVVEVEAKPARKTPVKRAAARKAS